MMQRSIGAFILALGGLLIWAAHFALLYGVQTAFCTVIPGGWSATGLRIAGLALTAVAVAVLLVLAGRPRLHMQAGSHRESAKDTDSARFLRQVSMAGATLALLAMLWATVPLLLLPACGPAAA
jgi:hypothetical protein